MSPHTCTISFSELTIFRKKNEASRYIMNNDFVREEYLSVKFGLLVKFIP